MKKFHLNWYIIGKEGTYDEIVKAYNSTKRNYEEQMLMTGLVDRNEYGLMILLDEKLNFSFYSLCLVGYKSWVLHKLPTADRIDLNSGLCGACRGNHIELIDFMIECGANDLFKGLHNACEKGNIDTFNLMYKYCQGYRYTFDLSECLSRACRYNNKPVIDALINKSNGNLYYNWGIMNACQGGYLNR